MTLYHPIKIKTGAVIFLPSSLPIELSKFVDTSHLIKENDLELFKTKLAILKLKRKLQ